MNVLRLLRLPQTIRRVLRAVLTVLAAFLAAMCISWAVDYAGDAKWWPFARAMVGTVFFSVFIGLSVRPFVKRPRRRR